MPSVSLVSGFVAACIMHLWALHKPEITRSLRNYGDLWSLIRVAVIILGVFLGYDGNVAAEHGSLGAHAFQLASHAERSALAWTAAYVLIATFTTYWFLHRWQRHEATVRRVEANLAKGT